MKLSRRLRRAWRGFFGGKDFNADMAEEMRLHLALREERHRSAGMPEEEARLAALRGFGGVDQIKETCREQRAGGWLRNMVQDLAYAARILGKAPGFTLVSVLILALGIGVTTAMFSVVYGVLLDPYPYAKSGEIWVPWITDNATGRVIDFELSDYLEIAKLPAVAAAMATSFDDALLTTEAGPQTVESRRISGSAFPFLGVAPVVGRYFTPADIKPDGESEPVLVLTHQLWLRLFAGRPDAVGKTVLMDDTPYTIIGVMPDRFGWYTNQGLWMPLPTTDPHRGVRPIVRLRPGVTREVAGQQLQSLFTRLSRAHPERFPKNGFSAQMVNYLDVTQASGAMQASLHALFWVVGVLLLIACTNVANLQLARGVSRSREIAVRMALGASRRRIVCQLLTESMGLSLVGGGLGVFFAYAFERALVYLMPAAYLPNEVRVSLNGWVLFFSSAVAVLTGMLSGLVPALQSTRADVNEALKDGGHAVGLGSRRGAFTRKALVVVEIALSIVLLVGAGLAVRGFTRLQRTQRGFDPTNLTLVRVPLLAKKYANLDRRSRFVGQVLEGMAEIPGVTSAAAGAFPGFGPDFGVEIPGQPQPKGHFLACGASADYFRTFGILIRDGRAFTAAQATAGDHVALINEAARKDWLNGSDPIGTTITVEKLGPPAPGGSTERTPVPLTIIGVVADTPPFNRDTAAQPAVYFPYPLFGNGTLFLFARSSVARQTLYKQLSAAVWRLDKDQPVGDVIPVDVIVDQPIAQPRFNMTLFSGFAALALGLAAAGLYSVISFGVVQRTGEIGVRIALGAERNDIIRLIFVSAGRVVATGVALGVVISTALTLLVRSEVFAVPLFDPLATAGSAVVLGLAATLACFIPARRAAAIDPLVAFRHD